MSFTAKILVPKSEYDQLKHIEAKYQQLLKSNQFKQGSGNSEELEILKRESQNELQTPILKLTSDDNDQKPLEGSSSGCFSKSVQNKSGKGENLNVVKKVPEKLKHKALLLLSKLESSSTISWDSNGQLIIQGTTVPGSNIQDLFKCCFINFRRQTLPGECDFFREIQTLGLENFILSVDLGPNPIIKWYQIII